MKWCKYCHDPVTHTGDFCNWFCGDKYEEKQKENASAAIMERLPVIKSHPIQGVLCAPWKSAITS